MHCTHRPTRWREQATWRSSRPTGLSSCAITTRVLGWVGTAGWGTCRRRRPRPWPSKCGTKRCGAVGVDALIHRPGAAGPDPAAGERQLGRLRNLCYRRGLSLPIAGLVRPPLPGGREVRGQPHCARAGRSEESGLSVGFAGRPGRYDGEERMIGSALVRERTAHESRVVRSILLISVVDALGTGLFLAAAPILAVRALGHSEPPGADARPEQGCRPAEFRATWPPK